MILNYERLIKHIVNWIRDYAKDNNKKTLITHHIDPLWNEVYDSELNKWFCEKTRMPVVLVDHKKSYEDCRKEAELHNGIVVGFHTLSDIFLRSYKKHQIGDILPLGDLHLTEAHELYRYLNLGDADVNLLGVRGWTASDIEWAHRQDVGPGPGPGYGIISGEEDPVRHRNWAGYSTKQREMVAEMHQIEKRTRHKPIDSIPKCSVRNIKGLVR